MREKIVRAEDENLAMKAKIKHSDKKFKEEIESLKKMRDDANFKIEGLEKKAGNP